MVMTAGAMRVAVSAGPACAKDEGDLDLRARCRSRSTTFLYRAIRWSRPGSRCSRGGSRTGPRGRRGRRTGPGAGPRARPCALSAGARRRWRRRGRRRGPSRRRRPRPRAPARRGPGSRSGASARCPGPRRAAAPWLPQRGLRSVPPPLIERGELGGRVVLVVHEVGDQAEHLRHLLALHVDPVFDDAGFHGDAVAGQLRRYDPSGRISEVRVSGMSLFSRITRVEAIMRAIREAPW